MTSRFRLAWLVGSLALAGCEGSFNPGPLHYEESEASDPRVGRQDQGQPRGQAQAPRWGSQRPDQAVRAESPGDSRATRVGAPRGGRYLANLIRDRRGPRGPSRSRSTSSAPRSRAKPPVKERQGGGYAALSPPLSPLPRRPRGGQRPDGRLPLSTPARLPAGQVQVHLHPQRPSRLRDDLRRDDSRRPPRHLDAGVRLDDGRPARSSRSSTTPLFLSMRGRPSSA